MTSTGLSIDLEWCSGEMHVHADKEDAQKGREHCAHLMTSLVARDNEGDALATGDLVGITIRRNGHMMYETSRACRNGVGGDPLTDLLTQIGTTIEGIIRQSESEGNDDGTSTGMDDGSSDVRGSGESGVSASSGSGEEGYAAPHVD